MKAGFLCLFFTAFSFLLLAQTSGNQEVIGSAGEELKRNGTSVSFTIGEISTQTHSGSTGSNSIITEGFQQEFFKVSTLVEESKGEMDIKVWPNPTVRYLNIDLGSDAENDEIVGEIVDLQGVSIEKFQLVEKSTLDLTTYPVSTYLLKIYDPQSARVRIFQIIKN